MVILLLGIPGTVVVLVRALPATAAGYLAAGLLGAAALPVMASPLEWLVHRHVYHRKLIPLTRRIYVIHHRGHHRAIFPTWRYVTNGPVRRHPIVASGHASLHTSSWRNLLIKLCHFAFYMTIGGVCVWLPAWLLTTNAGFLAGLIAASAAVSDLFVRVHDASIIPAGTVSSKPSRGSDSWRGTTTSITWTPRPTSISCCRWPTGCSGRCAGP
jgi:hypothetical protein